MATTMTARQRSLLNEWLPDDFVEARRRLAALPYEASAKRFMSGALLAAENRQECRGWLYGYELDAEPLPALFLSHPGGETVFAAEDGWDTEALVGLCRRVVAAAEEALAGERVNWCDALEQLRDGSMSAFAAHAAWN